jgi:hypothetical protein
MPLLRNVFRGGFLLAILLGSQGIRAQSNDGYHAIQVLPVVVDTASFTQRFYLHSGAFGTITVTPTYYPATGTAEPASSTCPEIKLDWREDVSYSSLLQLCPALAPGSMFGTLVLSSNSSDTFAVYSRVSNAAGAGFGVEGFPANVFNSGTSIVTGLRRSASTLSAKAIASSATWAVSRRHRLRPRKP